MDTERTLLQALHVDPADRACWLALADWLEEDGQAARAECLRLRLSLQESDLERRLDRERRLLRLLDDGVRPAVPVLTSSIGLRLALIPAGSFWMGSPASESGRYADEDPRHRVEISRAFYLGVYPVTQQEYQRVMGSNPSHFRHGGPGAPLVSAIDTSSFPVERISWDDAQAFCRKLSALPEEAQAGRVYRLPTEAEWEYACRAGTTMVFHFGNSLSSDRANIDGKRPEGDDALPGRSLERTCAVGSYPANAFGLHDMHGNVWEWCADWFEETYYERSPGRDPAGPTTGFRRVLRGGSWFGGARFCRSAYRYRYEPDAQHNEFGLRVALSL